MTAVALCDGGGVRAILAGGGMADMLKRMMAVFRGIAVHDDRGLQLPITVSITEHVKIVVA